MKSMSRTYHHHGKRTLVAQLSGPAILAAQQRGQSILESDPVYVSNFNSLLMRQRQGKIDKRTVHVTQPWLANAALRRAGVSIGESRQILPLVSLV